jgi:mono/diheme cytochrome c family protein
MPSTAAPIRSRPARSRVFGFALVVTLAAIVPSLLAQGDHAYTAQHIQAGMRLYADQCQQCHGPNGETVQGVNLRRGQFRRPMSDDDLRRTITAGIPAAGMPPFKLRPSEVDGLVAFIRAGFDAGGLAVKIGDEQKGKAAARSAIASADTARVSRPISARSARSVRADNSIAP